MAYTKCTNSLRQSQFDVQNQIFSLRFTATDMQAAARLWTIYAFYYCKGVFYGAWYSWTSSCADSKWPKKPPLRAVVIRQWPGGPKCPWDQGCTSFWIANMKWSGVVTIIIIKSYLQDNNKLEIWPHTATTDKLHQQWRLHSYEQGKHTRNTNMKEVLPKQNIIWRNVSLNCFHQSPFLIIFDIDVWQQHAKPTCLRS